MSSALAVVNDELCVVKGQFLNSVGVGTNADAQIIGPRKAIGRTHYDRRSWLHYVALALRAKGTWRTEHYRWVGQVVGRGTLSTIESILPQHLCNACNTHFHPSDRVVVFDVGAEDYLVGREDEFWVWTDPLAQPEFLE